MHIVVLLFDSVDYHMVMSLYVVVMCSGKWNTIQTLTLWIHLQMSAGGYKVVTFHFVEKKKGRKEENCCQGILLVLFCR